MSALRNTGEQVTLVVLPAGSVPPVAKTAPLYSSECIFILHVNKSGLSLLLFLFLSANFAAFALQEKEFLVTWNINTALTEMKDMGLSELKVL